MPDANLFFPVISEGRFDHRVLHQLRLAGVLPVGLDPKERLPTLATGVATLGGDEGVVQDVAEYATSRAIPRVVAMVDLDTHSVATRGQWFMERLRAHPRLAGATVGPTTAPNARLSLLKVDAPAGTTQVAVICAGDPANQALAPMGLTSFCMDDYILTLANDDRVYGCLQRGLVELAHVRQKLDELLGILRHNGIPATNTKRVSLLFRAIANLPVSPETFAERALKGALDGGIDLRAHFGPLLSDLQLAMQVLAGDSS